MADRPFVPKPTTTVWSRKGTSGIMDICGLMDTCCSMTGAGPPGTMVPTVRITITGGTG